MALYITCNKNANDELHQMRCVMSNPDFCLCENEGADQLRSNCEADQRLCFRYSNSTISLLLNPKFQASSHPLWLYMPICVRPGQNPRRPVFSHQMRTGLLLLYCCCCFLHVGTKGTKVTIRLVSTFVFA